MEYQGIFNHQCKNVSQQEQEISGLKYQDNGISNASRHGMKSKGKYQQNGNQGVLKNSLKNRTQAQPRNQDDSVCEKLKKRSNNCELSLELCSQQPLITQDILKQSKKPAIKRKKVLKFQNPTFNQSKSQSQIKRDESIKSERSDENKIDQKIKHNRIIIESKKSIKSFKSFKQLKTAKNISPIQEQIPLQNHYNPETLFSKYLPQYKTNNKLNPSKNMMLQPESLGDTYYSEIFPLGNKSYGMVYQNYYGLIIGNNKSLHIRRDAIPGSWLLFALIEIKENIIFMQTISLIEAKKPTNDKPQTKSKQKVKTKQRKLKKNRNKIREEQSFIKLMQTTKKLQLENEKQQQRNRIKSQIKLKEELLMLAGIKAEGKKIRSYSSNKNYKNLEDSKPDSHNKRSKIKTNAPRKSKLRISNSSQSGQYNVYSKPEEIKQQGKSQDQEQFESMDGVKEEGKENKANKKDVKDNIPYLHINLVEYSLSTKIEINRENICIPYTQTFNKQSEGKIGNKNQTKCQKNNLQAEESSKQKRSSNQNNRFVQAILSNFQKKVQKEGIHKCLESIYKISMVTIKKKSERELKEEEQANKEDGSWKDISKSSKSSSSQNDESLSDRKLSKKQRSQESSQSNNSNLVSNLSDSKQQNESEDEQSKKGSKHNIKQDANKNYLPSRFQSIIYQQESSSKEEQQAKIQIKNHISDIVIAIEYENEIKSTQKEDSPETSIVIYHIDLKTHLKQRKIKTKKKQSKKKHQKAILNNNEGQVLYWIAKCQTYNYSLKQDETTVQKNWLKIQKDIIYIVTSHTIYSIVINSILKNLNKNSHSLNKHKNKQTKNAKNDIGIICKNMKIIQKIIEYQCNKLGAVNQINNNKSGQPSAPWGNNNITNVVPNSAIQIINCCWINSKHFLILTSNNLVYQLHGNHIVNCQDLIKLIKTNNEQEKHTYGYQPNKQQQEENYNNIQQYSIDGMISKNQLPNNMLKIEEIDCIRNGHESSGMIIARIKAISDIIKLPSVGKKEGKHVQETSMNKNLKEEQRKKRVYFGDDSQLNKDSRKTQHFHNGILYNYQYELHLFKFNKRWTEYYLKVQNFINEKIMKSGLSSAVAQHTNCHSFHSKNSKNSINSSMISETYNTNNTEFNNKFVGNEIGKYNIHPQSICIKVLDNRNYIGQQHLRNYFQDLHSADTQKAIGGQQPETHVFCQWGIMIDHTISQKITHLGAKTQGKIKHTVNNILMEQFRMQQQSLSSINNPVLRYKILTNMEIFMAEINVFGKGNKNQEPLNPLCLRLQEYYNPNLKNIYQLKYKYNSPYQGKFPSQNQRNRNHFHPYQNKSVLTSFFSASANMFNFAILSQQGIKNAFTLYQKNIIQIMQPKHYLQMGLHTKPFLQIILHNFEPPYPPQCICLDSFALHLIVGFRQKIKVYYILWDKLIKGPQLFLNNIKYLKYDRFNWHLYAHNNNVLYIINPWRFEIQRQLAFEGEIQQIKIGDDFVFIKWKERSSSNLFLTIFPLYQAMAQNFMTYETQLDMYISKQEAQELEHAHSRFNSDNSQEEDYNNDSISKLTKSIYQFQNLSDHIALQYSYDAHAQTNILLLINQYYFEIHYMNFTEIYNQKEENSNKAYYLRDNTVEQGPSDNNIEQKEQDGSRQTILSKINPESISNPTKSNKSRKLSKFCENSNQTSSLSPSEKSSLYKINKAAQRNRNASMKMKEAHRIDSFSHLNHSSEHQGSSYKKFSSKEYSNSFISYSEDRITQKSSESQSQEVFAKQNQEVNIFRIRIKYNLPGKESFSKRNSKLSNYTLQFEHNQFPTCLKYSSHLSSFFVGTNYGKILTYKFNCASPQPYSSPNIKPQYCEKVSDSRIEDIMISKGVSSSCFYAFTGNQSILAFKITNQGKSLPKTNLQNLAQDIEEEDEIKSNLSNTNKNILSTHEINPSIAHIPIKIKQQQPKELAKSPEKLDVISNKPNPTKNNKSDYAEKLAKLTPIYVGSQQLHTLLSNTYRLYTNEQLQKLIQQIQELQLRLLKVRGDRQQFMVKHKRKYEEEINQVQKMIHHNKIQFKLEENKKFVINRNSMTNLCKFYEEERKQIEQNKVQKEKEDYICKLKALYQENDDLNAKFTELKNKTEQQALEYQKILKEQRNNFVGKYNTQLGKIEKEIDQMLEQIQRNKKIHQIELEQQSQELKEFRAVMGQKMDNLLQDQLHIESSVKYNIWNNLSNIENVKSQICQLQHLTAEFEGDIEKWKNAMDIKMSFYKKCIQKYDKLGEELDMRQKKYEQAYSTKNIKKNWQKNKQNFNITIMHQKQVYKLNYIIKGLIQNVQQKEEQANRIQQKNENIEKQINQTSQKLQYQQIQVYNKNNLIEDKIKYLQKLKKSNKQKQVHKLNAKNKVRKMMYQLFKLYEDFLDQNYSLPGKQEQVLIKNTSPVKVRNISNQLILDTLDYIRSGKHQQRHLHLNQYNNRRDSINFLQTLKQQQQQLQQYIKFLQLIKQRKNIEKVSKDLDKKQTSLYNSHAYKQTYTQNQELTMEVNKLRKDARQLQQTYTEIQKKYAQLKKERLGNAQSVQGEIMGSEQVMEQKVSLLCDYNILESQQCIEMLEEKNTNVKKVDPKSQKQTFSLPKIYRSSETHKQRIELQTQNLHLKSLKNEKNSIHQNTHQKSINQPKLQRISSKHRKLRTMSSSNKGHSNKSITKNKIKTQQDMSYKKRSLSLQDLRNKFRIFSMDLNQLKQTQSSKFGTLSTNKKQILQNNGNYGKENKGKKLVINNHKNKNQPQGNQGTGNEIMSEQELSKCYDNFGFKLHTSDQKQEEIKTNSHVDTLIKSLQQRYKQIKQEQIFEKIYCQGRQAIGQRYSHNSQQKSLQNNQIYIQNKLNNKEISEKSLKTGKNKKQLRATSNEKEKKLPKNEGNIGKGNNSRKDKLRL